MLLPGLTYVSFVEEPKSTIGGALKVAWKTLHLASNVEIWSLHISTMVENITDRPVVSFTRQHLNKNQFSYSVFYGTMSNSVLLRSVTIGLTYVSFVEESKFTIGGALKYNLEDFTPGLKR